VTGATVFVVDDDAAVGRSVAKLVRVLGYDSRTFDSAESFLSAYEGGPGCLVVDVRMPGMSGLELLDELGRRGLSLPAIVMSGHVERSLPPRPTPVLGVLEKPFSATALKELLAGWRAGGT